MNQKIEKEFNLGGSLERALSGDYQLRVGAILREGVSCTIKNFWSFTPAVFILLAVQLLIFYIVLKLQLPDLRAILEGLQNPEQIDPRFVQAFVIAVFSFEVVSAPISAGASLMAMSHAAGLKTQTRHISKGLQFTVSVILATLIIQLTQSIVGQLFWILSMYASIAFSHTILLICEKRLPIFKALLISLKATNRKIIPLTTIYFIMMLLTGFAIIFYGIGFIFVLPFFLHVKGILYRNMFGIRLTIISTSNSDQQNKVFNA
ncbi:hypothetical protein [Vibrio mangrovi]|uniref:Uncharacterized protein n=1 Tax=Vibrio mangrovi TaxID=474394 RepID=A0A1Y6IQ20_9VIBR|nr:hypothetical protein [Vibrio mangrovi]MDW6004041.1 hypothetical protein [Vibrio mangrovi]SMR99161.1 hypothetical protein VIM7927_00384 [Vibrio mangrovi]